MSLDLSIFKSPDPSGRLFKESFLMKNHIGVYEYINQYSSNNGLDLMSFKERVYLCLNNMTSAPICKNVNCSNVVRFKNSTIGYVTFCSRKCISSDIDTINKKKKNSLLKFGTDHPSQSRVVKDKIIETNNSRYGGNSPMSSVEVMNKSRQTLIDNYGVDNPSKNQDLLKKRVSSFLLSDYRESYKKSSNIKYGTDHPWNIKEIHKKSVDTSMDTKKKISMSVVMERLSDYPGYKLIDHIKGEFEVSFLISCPRGHNFVISRNNLYRRNLSKSEICTECNPIDRKVSGQEISLYNFIVDNYSGEILRNTRTIISPYEIDIYLPDLKIGFEYNGLYWHSSSRRGRNYHFNKYKMSTDAGIDIITIWEDDWQVKSEIVKSFILNKLGKSKKIFARKCKIGRVDYPTSRLFLEHNHLQGDCKSSIRIGLFYESSLVSLMAFSKPRIALGGRQSDGSYELTRFCNLVGHTVVGGASRLLKFFIETHLPKDVLSYSDNLISNGDLYEKLGFEFSHISKPGYWYLIDGIREHRFNWRKSKLIKMGFDPVKTEEEIMSENGHYRVYNGGNKKWVFKCVE